ncbi:hypothetical protein KRR38_01420 [Novosphingobium sp. G106]|uniref:hypothetical protein n=1 Tax=Novosphingobium sp. G106 TaxID=2849500 RepID=UPI001C2DE63A|nr:hypothetical protein [Novosphingobium sp. G106]MBV1686364.1 hypothetical protein [Novosphingobium sp. G106]
MKRASTIADLLSRPGMFYRSVALERDAADPSAGRSFVLTPWLERGASEIISGMRPGGTRRAWRIIGDFGVGKSALALALLQALDPRVREAEMPMGQLADRLGDVPRMFPLLVTGSKDGLSVALATAIDGVLGTEDLLPRASAKKVRSFDDPFAAVTALRDALRATKQFDGLLIVIDEMGKFLEVSGEEHGFDVFQLQALAETASRSGKAPLGVVLILHKGFQSYTEDWRTARRSEWEKVSERFEEMVFDHPLSHTAALLSAALGVDQAAMLARVRRSHEDVLKRVRALGWLGPRNATGTTGSWPVHPAAVPVMARFFASFGQNERSLFGFAASEEPNSLRAFAAETPMGNALYGIHHFFDYVTSSFGHRLTSRGGAGEWDRIRAVLDRAADADAAETTVLKTIGMLNLLDAPDLFANADTVRESLVPAFSADEVDGAIDRLVTDGLVFTRPGRSDLRLWTSRRVDLSTIWAEAETAVDTRDVTRDLPRHLAVLPMRQHVMARKHSVLTGTSRRFSVRFTHASGKVADAGHGDGDGAIVAVLCGNDEDLLMARALSAEITAGDDAMLALVVPAMPELGPLMVDLLRHRWVVSNAAALQEDAFAMAEIERSVTDLEARLISSMELALGLRGHAPTAELEVFRKGAAIKLDAPIHTVVSTLCDEIYREAPKVENELVNRHSLTSAGAGGRQRLIESMFDYGHDPELGFASGKNPPERALYLSLLRRGRVHRQVDGEWSITPPKASDDPLRLLPALDAIERRLAGDSGRVPLPEIYQLVETAPYGVRRGLAPLLLAIKLVSAGHRVALFERGTYCTRLDGAAFMRILKAPGHFALQWVALEGIRADVFHRLAQLLDKPPADSGIRLVVDPLIHFGVGLPFHVTHTAVLGPEARAVRQLLSQSRSPVDLLFAELPTALGVEPFAPCATPDADAAGRFVSLLSEAVSELRSCYPRLLETMREETLKALGAPDRASLAERAAAMVFRVHEQNLRTFAMRLADNALGEDPWTEALGGAVIGKPPMRWLDYDVESWRSQMAELVGQFLRVEAAAFGKGATKRNAVRVCLTRADGHERAVVVDIDGLNDEQSKAIGAIERLAKTAELSLDIVAALLSLGSMQREKAAPSQPDEKRESA